jgi:hypothetical protein
MASTGMRFGRSISRKLPIAHGPSREDARTAEPGRVAAGTRHYWWKGAEPVTGGQEWRAT